jgi:cation transport protein ChaC
MYSTRYRGTPEQPGLVLGLDRGGCCRGIAFLIRAADVEAALGTLWAREMPRLIYEPRCVNVEMGDQHVKALTFVADRAHESYAGRLALENVAQIIAGCCGERGPNADYLFNTLRHLDSLGIEERHLNDIRLAVQTLQHPRSRAGVAGANESGNVSERRR